MSSAGPDLRAERVPSPAPAGAVAAARPRARRRPSVPRPLAALLCVVALVGVTWALLVPAWQAPDEDVHFAYVETLVERGELPGSGRFPLSLAQFGSMQALNTDPTVFFSYAQPELSRAAWEAYLARRDAYSDTSGGAPNAAATYPPGYYLYETLGYRAAADGPLEHLYSARLASVLWLLVTTIATWLLAGELLGRRRDLQLLAAACVGLWPMLVFVSASVNPDSMLYATWALTLWLGVAILRRGLTPARGIGLGAAVGLALITKATSLALAPAVAFVVAVAGWRLLRTVGLRRAAIATVATVAVAGGPFVAWQVTQRSLDRPAYSQARTVNPSSLENPREFASYVWQFYLPRLPFQQDVDFNVPTVSAYPAFNVWVATGWAAFGWVTVYFPVWLYWVFLGITVLLAAAVLTGLTRWVRERRGSPVLRRTALPVACFVVLAAGALLAGLHLNEYGLRSPTNQGRYLFPLAALAGTAVAFAVSRLPDRPRRFAVGGVLGALLVFQLACLGLVAQHYYA